MTERGHVKRGSEKREAGSGKLLLLARRSFILLNLVFLCYFCDVCGFGWGPALPVLRGRI